MSHDHREVALPRAGPRGEPTNTLNLDGREFEIEDCPHPRPSNWPVFNS
jgi:hypothetical protein